MCNVRVRFTTSGHRQGVLRRGEREIWWVRERVGR